MNEKAKEFDETELEYNLTLTPEERLEQHQAALDVVTELEKARDELYEKSQSDFKDTN